MASQLINQNWDQQFSISWYSLTGICSDLSAPGSLNLSCNSVRCVHTETSTQIILHSGVNKDMFKTRMQSKSKRTHILSYQACFVSYLKKKIVPTFVCFLGKITMIIKKTSWSTPSEKAGVHEFLKDFFSMFWPITQEPLGLLKFSCHLTPEHPALFKNF